MVSFTKNNNNRERSHANFVICYSPFQAYMWLTISKQKLIHDAKVLYISYHDTKKDRYYVSELRKTFQFVEYFLVQGYLWTSIPALNKKLKGFNFGNAEIDLYLASFNAFFSMYIFNKIHPSSIFIFDDGIFSIINELEGRQHRFNINSVGIFRKIFLKMLLSKTNDSDLIKEVKKFYTLFPSNQTIVDKTKVEAVRIMYDSTSRDQLESRDDSSLQIFIGDVPSELTPNLLKDYRNILKILPIDYYLPHPRSRELYCPPGKELLLDVVAEEFISSMLSIGNCVTVYALLSTVLFTLNEHPNLTKIMIRHPDALFPSLYDCCSNYGIQLVDSDDLLTSSS